MVDFANGPQEEVNPPDQSQEEQSPDRNASQLLRSSGMSLSNGIQEEQEHNSEGKIDDGVECPGQLALM